MKKPDQRHKAGKKVGQKKSDNKFAPSKDKKFTTKSEQKEPFREEKKPSVFDKAFVDPDKVRRQKEREEDRGPSEEIVFSKSIDDLPNPKYGVSHEGRKEDFTPKERQKYREKFPHLADKNRKPATKERLSSDDQFDEKRKKRDSAEQSFRGKKRGNDEHRDGGFRPRGAKFDKDRSKKVPYDSPHFKQKFTPFSEDNKAYTHRLTGKSKNKFDAKDKKLEKQLKADYESDKMPLNKFIARCGVCSRRDAVELIKAQRVKVNDEIIVEPGYKVQEEDVVRLDGKKLHLKEEFVYILLNKPKGYITTLDDPKGRRIISELYADEIQERIFPVGRLDRNTTGLLLITNDGDLSNKLAHPKYQVRKIYQVQLDKPVSGPHMQQILDGLELEDGIAQVDHISYLQSKDEIGIEIHSGKNRIVRRIFEHLGYVVEKLDRVLYAGLTKKNLPKGKWRMLSRQEVINLKHLNRSS